MSPGLGLNAYLRQQDRETLLVPVETAEILVDLDTPEDYLGLQQSWQKKERHIKGET
jgi:CTP:molybdopterin cytidylyltransferase MocA